MPDSSGNTPTHMSPFRDTAVAYRKAKWFGTLPLPARQKSPPPTGYTGHVAPYPDKDKLLEWLNDSKHRRANICLRLGGVDKDYEIIGIDVDHYLKGGEEKRGGDQLKTLEDSYGKLPETWTSSARTDGVSGIRYFRVPRGLAFRGQVDKDIECIQKGHRFAVVWPSYNPDSQSDYWWFPPGADLSVDGRNAWNVGEVPDATQLPLLPDRWIDHLTQGRITAGEVEIDMDSSVDEIYAWADETLPEGTTLCYRMREKMEKHLRLIADEATSHDKIVNAHMNMMHLAMEGHTGWTEAINQIEQQFVSTCIERDKRDLNELRGEIFRSRSRGLRRVKAKIDAQISIGAQGVPDRDTECDTGDSQGIPLIVGGSVAGTGPPGNDLFDIPRGQPIPTPEYRTNDDGNADHFADTFHSVELGPVVRFIDGYGWIVWHNGDGGERQPHWERDQFSDGIMRRMFWSVRDRLENYAEACRTDWTNLSAAFANQTPGVSAADVRDAKSLMGKWLKFAEGTGNNRNARNALEALKSKPGIRKSLAELDSSPDVLGVANGVVELNPDGAKLRRAEPEDYITLNTGTPWLADDDVSTIGKKLWREYLEKFLPDEEYRRDVQIALGHCLLGGNPHKKLFVFKGHTNTGKSVMISMVNEVLGDYASTVNKSLFQYHKLNPVLALALPKRVVSIIELSRDTKNALTIDQIKTATGNDVVQAELKGANETVERVPFFVPIIVTNTVPNIEGADKALRERLHVVDFDVVEEHPDDTIAARMRHESKAAVLAWLIEGYNLYCANGRKVPVNAKMNQAKIDFAAEMDDISEFANECLEPHTHMGNLSKNWARDASEWCTTKDAIFSRYQRWLGDNEIPTKEHASKNKLTSRLKELGFVDTRDKVRSGGRHDKFWLGTKMKPSRNNTPIASDILKNSGIGDQK